MIRSPRIFVREAIKGLVRAPGLNALTIGIVAASLTIVGVVALLMENLRGLADDWNRVQIHAYLKDDAVTREPERIDLLLEDLGSRPTVASVRYISREEALGIFRESFSDLAGAPDLLEENPFPASIEIAVTGERDERLDRTRSLIEQLRGSDLVESVQDNASDAKRIVRLSGIVTRIGVGLTLILGATTTFIIFNVIRLAVHSRRDEIAILRLVGATPGFIRGPFVVEGMLQGLIGALAALVILYAVHAAVADYAIRAGSQIAGLLSARFLSPALAVQLATGGALIGLAGSLLSLRKHLLEET